MRNIEVKKQRGALVLETGEIFWGQVSSSAQSVFPERAGEVVFNTSHSGYEEIATDPSYFSQIVLMTASQQGNYGIEDEVWESRKIWIEGFICLQNQDSMVDSSWSKRLATNQVPLLTDIDTRSLTLRLRSGGTVWGAIVSAEEDKEALSKALSIIKNSQKKDKDWVYLTSRQEVEIQKGLQNNSLRALVLDFGCKENILRELKKFCTELIICPSRTPYDVILSYKPDFIMLTNGPGNPEDVEVAPSTIRSLLGKIPIFGICMGHQILGLALGAKTYKLKFGHRGSNHPIQDHLLNKIYMTSQNHGYAIDEKTLPFDVQVTHYNLNDNTVAGIFNSHKKFLSVQFHPESCPGPHEASELFYYFVKRVI